MPDVMKKIRIESDGTYHTTKVTEVATGKMLPVKTILIKAMPERRELSVYLELADFEISISGDAKIVEKGKI